MQVSTHDQDTPAANKQHKIEDQLPEYFNHGRILAPLAGIIPDLSFNLVGHHGLQPFQREGVEFPGEIWTVSFWLRPSLKSKNKKTTHT